MSCSTAESAPSPAPLVFLIFKGNGSLRYFEDLALHQVVGNGGAVEGDEGLLATGAALVDGLGAHLLAGAALAGDEHGRLARRRALDDAIDRLHRHGGTDETGKRAALEVLPVLGHQRAELLVLEGIACGGAQPLAVERFGQKVEGTEPHRLHRHVHRAVGGDHHHRAGQLLFGDLLQDVHAGHVGQLEIQQHHRRRAAQQLRQCLLAAIGPQHLVAILGQILFIDHRQTAGIFHQQDSRFAFSHGSHPCN
uniref:Similarity with known prokaryotic or eukaryotic proteins n=1 Tax=Aeromonas hydrophila TaxID=644 RepID=O07049_AERHY|nr:ORF5; no significant similarity with known prokaryotic or eukaryotic proteins [Aeromonas hydrophila]